MRGTIRANRIERQAGGARVEILVERSGRVDDDVARLQPTGDLPGGCPLLQGTTHGAVVGDYPEVRAEAVRIVDALKPSGPATCGCV